jgi:glucose/arabinose dehydrogenase
MLGDDIPADELNNATAPGQHFGYPFCHAGDIADPKYGNRRDCDEFRKPAQNLGAHVAALGLSFYTGKQFPQQYRGQLFIAEHGSWNRSKKSGYRITLVELSDGRPVSYKPFATGWLRNESVSGRPVDIVMAADGALLVSDDREGRIYRISYAQHAAGNPEL